MAVSKTPKKNRVAINPPQLVTRPWKIRTRPNMNMQIDTIYPSAIYCPNRRRRVKLTPDMGLELLQHHIRRDFEDDVRHEENCERGVISRSFDNIQIFLESENSGIRNIDSATVTSANIKKVRHPMFSYLSKNARRYIMQIGGRICQSILAINLRSVVVVRGGNSPICELAWLSP